LNVRSEQRNVKGFGLNQWSSTGAKSAPCGDFMRYVGDVVTYQIWGAISVSRVEISAG